MSRLTLSDFKRQFREVIDPNDRIIVVYSGIWTFGHRFGLPIADIPRALVEAMLSELGAQQTLLLPSYTYAYTRTRHYSPEVSAPETGVLPLAMLKHFQPVRSRSALNSFLAIGPQSRELAEIRGATLWGAGSLKAHFQEQHARMVVLGLPWKDACGFLHRIEEVCNVPYRYHKTFSGIWSGLAGDEPWSETMFVRPMTLLPVFRWQMVDELVRSRGGVRSGAGEIHLESADAADLVQAGIEILAEDKLALLTNQVEVRNWIEKERVNEIAALRRSEPRSLDHLNRSVG
jgi:aminoglycoside 3-N-acetyltransferase